MTRHLEQALLAELIHGEGGERFAFASTAGPRLKQALSRDLAAADPLRALEAALRLAAAMDGELCSPGAATSIRDLLRDEPSAVAVLRARERAPRPIDTVRAFLDREDRATPTRAPSFRATETPGAIPLRSFLDPGTQTHGRPAVRAAQRR